VTKPLGSSPESTAVGAQISRQIGRAGVTGGTAYAVGPSEYPKGRSQALSR